jgi:hypothetical protein
VFHKLQRALMTAPILQLLDFDNASGTSFGVMLHQGMGPVAYFSRPFAMPSWPHTSVN